MKLGSKELLPDHIDKIVEFVPPRDLTNLSRASTSLRDATRRPHIWRNMILNKTKISQDGLTRLFSINKFKQVRVIDMSFMTLTTPQLVDNLRAISSSCVEELNLRRVSGISFRQVPATLLGEVARKLKKLDLEGTGPTPDQCLAVLEASASSTTLKELVLAHSPLPSVPQQLLAQAVRNLHKVNLGWCLRSDQCTTILGACASSTTLNDVNLSGNSLSHVPVDLLGRAVGNLARVSLAFANLNTEQCLVVMEACISSNKLISAEFAGNYLRGVPPQKLREAAEKLQVINLDRTMLTKEQCLGILQASVSSSQLTDVSMTYINFEEVPVDALTQAVAHLRRLNLWYSRMTSLQKISVLQAIVESSCTVRLDWDEDVPALLVHEARETGRLQ